VDLIVFVGDFNKINEKANKLIVDIDTLMNWPNHETQTWQKELLKLDNTCVAVWFQEEFIEALSNEEYILVKSSDWFEPCKCNPYKEINCNCNERSLSWIQKFKSFFIGLLS